MTKERIKVGRVSALHCYPVKSMSGESADAARLTWHGVEHDRRYAIVLTGDSSGFPWLTARIWPEITLYQAYVIQANAGERPRVSVRTPSARDFSIDSPELMDEICTRSGRSCHLLQHFGGVFDCSDLSIITSATARQLSERIGADLDLCRFRPNIVIETADDKSFPEDKWVGDLLIIGESGDLPRIRINRKDQRCMVVNVNPTTGKQDAMILKEIVGSRKNMAGVYGTTERPGMIQVGDPVWLQKS